jgi:TolB-like protein
MALDIKKIGRGLNVRNVLEGSVQRSGKRFRVNVQPVDAETANTYGPIGFTNRTPIFLTCRMRLGAAG